MFFPPFPLHYNKKRLLFQLKKQPFLKIKALAAAIPASPRERKIKGFTFKENNNFESRGDGGVAAVFL
ncbi:MAG: hypothetical protein IJ043_10270 [Clostridia bacterium]|nr:hypothetical protein [Clostridia bacterium]